LRLTVMDGAVGSLLFKVTPPLRVRGAGVGLRSCSAPARFGLRVRVQVLDPKSANERRPERIPTNTKAF